jgi:hypothetical protein
LFLESVSTRSYLPGFAGSHRMALLDERVEPRIWIGNTVKVNTHFDLAHNIACVVGGRRRFHSVSPDQIGNLYLAPLDFTPSGAPVSLVQFTAPDHLRFPRYAEALRHAMQVELGPGDALFIPYGWWHHVESLATLNVLVNYWWTMRRNPECRTARCCMPCSRSATCRLASARCGNRYSSNSYSWTRSGRSPICHPRSAGFWLPRPPKRRRRSGTCLPATSIAGSHDTAPTPREITDSLRLADFQNLSALTT